ncbi:efflux RND transporter periplasmic adaptor subunit [Patescibacteria group bacterium]
MADTFNPDDDPQNTTIEESVSSGDSNNVDSGNATEVEIAEITDEPLSRINFKKVGTVEPYKKVTIMSESSGTIKDLDKTEGDTVTKGTQIAEISDSVSTEIAQINYENAVKTLNLAKESLLSTQSSISQDAKSAIIGAETALLNYENAINSYNNLAATLEEQMRVARIGIQAAEIGFKAAQESYYTSVASNKVTLENTLDQSLGGIISALSLVDSSIETMDSLYGVRKGSNNDNLEEVLYEHTSRSTVNNAKDDLEDINDEYYNLYNDYDDVRSSNDADDIQDLIYDVTELLEDTQELLYDSKELINDVLHEDGEDIDAVEGSLIGTKSSINAFLPSIDQSKSGLRQSNQGIDGALTNNQIQPEGAFTGLQSSETQLLSAKQSLEQLEAANKSQLDNALNGIDLAAKQVDNANAQIASIQAKGKLQEIGAKTQVAQLEGQVAITETNLSGTKIKAPIDGIIIQTFIDEGNYVNNSQKIVSVADMSKVKIVAFLTAEELSFVKLGQTVSIEAPGGIKQTGRITKVLPTVDPVSKKIQVEIIIPNDDDSFKSGMFADVLFVDAQKESPSINVPFKSIVFEQSTPYIYVVENGKAVRKKVALGQISGNLVEITDGITRGDKLIIKGAKLVKDGSPVTIVSK